MEKDFIKAAKNGDVDRLSELLRDNPSLIGARDKDGSTALHCACWKGHKEAVTLLIGAGADVHARNENTHWGSTPLHAAAHADEAAIAELLVAAGADVNALDIGGKTPLHHTTIHNAKAAAKVIEKHGGRV